MTVHFVYHDQLMEPSALNGKVHWRKPDDHDTTRCGKSFVREITPRVNTSQFCPRCFPSGSTYRVIPSLLVKL